MSKQTNPSLGLTLLTQDLQPDLGLIHFQSLCPKDAQETQEVLGLTPDHILQLITENGIIPEYIRVEISEVSTEAIGGPIISVGETEAFIHGASITEVAMELPFQLAELPASIQPPSGSFSILDPKEKVPFTTVQEPF